MNYRRKLKHVLHRVLSAPRFIVRKRKILGINTSPLLMLVVLLLQLSGPLLIYGYNFATSPRYTYLAERKSITGPTLPKIASQIKEDITKEAYVINPSGVSNVSEAPLAMLQKSVTAEDTDKLQYAAEIGMYKPTVTVYDSQLDVSFSTELLVDTHKGRLDGSKVLYPTKDTNIGVVYSAKNNGIKEDIIVNKATQNEMSYDYKITLPTSLDARMLNDGSLGVYSADPALFSNMTFGTEADRELIEQVKANSEKSHLAFVIPAPTIIAENGQIGNAGARFEYKKDEGILTVHAYNLMDIDGIFSIDPTTVITSTSDFSYGNDEGNIDFNTANALNVLGASGGSVGSWSNANTGGNAGGARVNQATVVYKGMVYILGGWTGSVQSRVDYGVLDSSGNVTSWTNTTAMPHPRTAHKAVAHNNYIYVVGGCSGYTNYGAPYFNNCTPGTNKNYDMGLGGMWNRSVSYAPICDGVTLAGGCNNGGTPRPNGYVGTWTTDTDYFTNAREWMGAAIYNGRIYIAGGRIDAYPAPVSDTTNDVQYAPILADGSIGAWTIDSGTSFSGERMYSELAIYNGYMYIVGGYYEETYTYLDTVQYAPINDDGSIGTWAAGPSFNDSRGSHKITIHRGYLYMVGGYDGAGKTDLQYVPIHSDGTLGTWNTSTSVANRDNVGLHGWGDYLIWLSGDYVTNYCEKATISPNGSLNPISGAWQSTTSTSAFRSMTAAVAYNGFVYMVGGGNTAGTALGTTDRAAINADGTLGTWSTTGTGLTARQGHAVEIYNGYIYAIGGATGANGTSGAISSIQYAPINQDGTIGTWQSTTALSGNRAHVDAVAYRGFMYVLGGDDFSGGGGQTVDYFTIDSAGTLSGIQTNTTNLPASAAKLGAFAYNGYMYISGGQLTSSSTLRSTTHYRAINSDGTLGGSWQTTTALPSARSGHSFTIYAGNVHVMGGCTTISTITCSAWTTDAHFAPINTNGTIGTYTATTALPNSRWDHGAVAYNGFMYVIDGRNGSTQQGTLYLRINNGGGGAANSWTSSANNLGTATTKHASVAYNGFLYTLGGCTAYTPPNCTAFSNAVQYSNIADGGRPGVSSTTTAFPTGRYGHSAAVIDGYMYIFGGCSASTGGTCTNYLNDTRFARILPDGTLSDWIQGPNLVTARHSASVAVGRGYVYIAGGTNGSSLTSVEYARLTGQGGISAWTGTSASLATARRDLTLVSSNGYVYALGGYDGTNILRSVEYASIGSNGNISTWAYTTPMPVPLYGHTAQVYNARIYVAGGCSQGVVPCTIFNNKIHQVELHGNGHIRNIWETSVQTFTTARMDAGSALYEGMYFVTGGCSAGSCTSILNNISYAGMRVAPHISEYSRMIDVGTTGRSIESFTYTSTGAGNVDVFYRFACTDYELTTNRVPLEYDINSGEDALFNDVDARFVQLYIIMDSSFDRTYPSPALMQLQDFTLSYTAAHPNPSEQMRLGNAFIDEVEVGFGVRPSNTTSLSCI